MLHHCGQAMAAPPTSVASRLRRRGRYFAVGDLVWGFELNDHDHNGSRWLARVNDSESERGYEVYWIRCGDDVVDWYPQRALEPLCICSARDYVLCYGDNDYHHTGPAELAQVFGLEDDGPFSRVGIVFQHENEERHNACVYVQRYTLEYANVPWANYLLSRQRIMHG